MSDQMNVASAETTGTDANTQNAQPAAQPAQQTAGQNTQPQPQEKPAEYNVSLPKEAEGELDPEAVSAFVVTAKDLGIPQDTAQKLLDRLAPVFIEREYARLDAARTEWENQARSDKEFGGDALDANLAVAKKALDTFGTPELREMLRLSGVGSHPEVIRLFYRVGRALAEDNRIVRGDAAADKPSLAKRLYTASNLN